MRETVPAAWFVTQIAPAPAASASGSSPVGMIASTSTGHYTTTFNSQSNPPERQFTVGGPFDVVAVGADGSRVVFHLISRTTRTPDGTVTVSFNVTRFECVPPAA